jgi:hypothetical protein
MFERVRGGLFVKSYQAVIKRPSVAFPSLLSAEYAVPVARKNRSSLPKVFSSSVLLFISEVWEMKPATYKQDPVMSITLKNDGISL